jgi:hypothetical protein
VTGHAGEAELGSLRAELTRTAEIGDPTEEMLEIAAIVAAAPAPAGIRPVVVGGLAVAYWTTGLYLTADIDVVMPHSAAIEERLSPLGFEREGRIWTLPGREPVLERRSEEESLSTALAALRTVADRIEHESARLEIWDITDLARSLRDLPFGPAEEP